MTTNTCSTEYKMIIWSFDFIKHHRDMTTEDLPDVLIKFWSIPDFVTNPYYKEDDVQLMVFMFILRLHKFSEKKADDFINSFRFKQLFHTFQVILAATAYCREMKLKIKPFPIFDIERYVLPEINDEKELLKMYDLITTPGQSEKASKSGYTSIWWRKLSKIQGITFCKAVKNYFQGFKT